MWRRPSKSVSLGIDRDALALRIGDAQPIPFALQTGFNDSSPASANNDHTIPALDARPPTQPMTLDTLSQLFSPFASALSGATLKVTLSNQLCRFDLLPWQTGLEKRADWEALARHRLREIHGAIVAEWAVQLAFQSFGQRVLVAAMDQALLDTLQAVVNHFGCRQWSVQPVLAHALDLQRRAQQNDGQTGKQRLLQHHIDQKSALLVAEPTRALYLQQDHMGWQRLDLTAMPATNALDALNACVRRGQQQTMQAEDRPEKLPVYALLASAFKAVWSPDALPGLHLLQPLTHSTSHAAWLAVR